MATAPRDMRWTATAAAVIAAVVDALYLGIVGSSSHDPQFLRVPFVAVFIALMAMSAALAARRSSGPIRPFLLGLSAAGFLVLGYFAIFSIGLLLIVAGVLALYALVRASSIRTPGRRSLPMPALAAAGAIISVALLAGGFALTEVVVSCPPIGAQSVSGTSILGGEYRYSCVNGKLTVSR